MAGSAQKKREKSAKDIDVAMLAGIGIVALLFMTYRLGLGAGLTLMQWVGFALQTLFALGLRSYILVCVRSGYYFDILVINQVAQLGWAYTDWFLLIYLTVPSYIIYKGVSALLKWVFTPTAEELAEKAEVARRAARRAPKGTARRR